MLRSQHSNPLFRALLILSMVVAPLFMLAGTTPAEPNASTTQPPAALNFYFGNLHSHTAYSDGTGTPKEAYAYARDVAKLDFLAITEHNHIKAEGTGDDPLNLHIADPNTPDLYDQFVADANAANQDGQFVAIYGQEFSTMTSKGGNHTNALMANKLITTTNGDYLTVFTQQWINQHGVEVIQFNHPWELEIPANKIGTPQDKNYSFNKYPTRAAFVQAVDGKVSLVEVINGPGTVKPAPGQTLNSKRNASYYMRYLNIGLHVAPTADQDNHWRTWGTHTFARTVVLAPQLTRAAILTALKKRHVYASQDEDLKIHFTVNGEIMGSQIDALPEGEEVNIEVKIEDDNDGDTAYLVKLYYDNQAGWSLAKVVDQGSVDNKESIAFSHVPKKGKGYYFLEVKSTKGGNKGLMAWTAPVWLE